MGEHPLVIRLERIGAEGLDVNEAVEIEWLNEALGSNSPYRPKQAGRLDVHLERIAGDDGADTVVHVRGRAAVDLQADCSRCLELVDVAFNAPVEVAMFPADKVPAPASDGELDPDDMGVATYDAEGVNLAALVHDEVFLELPMNPVCRETCAGLCAQCGANLNEKPCDCERTDKSWNAFRDIKLD